VPTVVGPLPAAAVAGTSDADAAAAAGRASVPDWAAAAVVPSSAATRIAPGIGSRRRHLAGTGVVVLPEIIEVEPVAGSQADMVFEAPGVLLHTAAQGRLAMPARQFQAVGKTLEVQIVTPAATVQA